MYFLLALLENLDDVNLLIVTFVKYYAILPMIFHTVHFCDQNKA